jgi:hypothetical protein
MNSKPYRYDLAVAWRIYPGISKTPIIFPTDKFKLVENCLLSFILAARWIKVKYFIILDGCPDEYVELIQSLLPAADTEIIRTLKIGNLPTFAKQVEILMQQEDADTVYFAEDDYLYQPDSFHHLLEFLHKSGKADFVTGYCHRDIFTHPIHKPNGDLQVFDDHVWIEDNSTTMTFLTTKKVLKETAPLLLTYSKGNNDCAMWLVMTKTRILNPFNYIRYFFTHKESYNILKVGVKRSFRYFFNRKRYRLWVPHPALSTHLESGLESPGVDWVALSDKIAKRQLSW